MKKLLLILLFIPHLVLSQNKVFDFNEFDKFSEEYVNNDEPGIIYNIYSNTKNINWSKAFGINAPVIISTASYFLTILLKGLFPAAIDPIILNF